MNRPSAELMAEVYPGVELRGERAASTRRCSRSRKARRLLGYDPQVTWRDQPTGRST